MRESATQERQADVGRKVPCIYTGDLLRPLGIDIIYYTYCIYRYITCIIYRAWHQHTSTRHIMQPMQYQAVVQCLHSSGQHTPTSMSAFEFHTLGDDGGRPYSSSIQGRRPTVRHWLTPVLGHRLYSYVVDTTYALAHPSFNCQKLSLDRFHPPAHNILLLDL